MSPFHRLLRGYRLAPDHPTKLRLYGWLRDSPAMRSAVVQTHGATYRLDLRDYVQHEIFLHGAYETASFARFLDLLEPGDCVVDIGANIGQYALGAAQRIGAGGRVIAIEPNPRNCEQLLENRRLSGAEDIVEVFLTAISDAPGLVDFEVPHATALGLSRMKASGSTGESFAVQAMRLADLLKARGVSAIKALKIDVEGAEMTVLRSLFEHEAPRPEHIIFEFIPEAFDGSGDLPGYIAGQGYEILGIDGRPYDGGERTEHNLWARRTKA